MAIKRTKQILASQALPRLGWIHKGVKVGHPMDTDRFWISFDPTVIANPDAALAAWRSLNGLEPYAQLTDNELKEALKNPNHKFAPRELSNVFIISNQFDDDDGYRVYHEKQVKTANNKRVMVRRCTTETIVAEMKQGKDFWGIYDRSPKPCLRVIASAQGKDPNNACDCKLEAHLRLVIPALLDAARLPYGYFELDTSAWRDDANIYTALGYTQQNWADPYGIPLSQVPFRLWRESSSYNFMNAKGKSEQKNEAVIHMAASDEHMARVRQMQPILVRQIQAASPLPAEELEPTELEEVDFNEAESDESPVDFTPLEELVLELDKACQRYLGFSGETILAHFNCKDYAAFFALYPTWDAISAAVTRLLVEAEISIRVYGTRTVQKDESGVKYLMNFGFGHVFAYSRDEFKIEGYDKDMDYTSMVNDKAVQRNLRFLGDHFFSEVFQRDFVIIRLKLNEKNNLDIAEVRDPKAIPM